MKKKEMRQEEIDNIKLVLVQDIHICMGLATILATALVDKIKVGTAKRFVLWDVIDNCEHFHNTISEIEIKPINYEE